MICLLLSMTDLSYANSNKMSMAEKAWEAILDSEVGNIGNTKKQLEVIKKYIKVLHKCKVSQTWLLNGDGEPLLGKTLTVSCNIQDKSGIRSAILFSVNSRKFHGDYKQLFEDFMHICGKSDEITTSFVRFIPAEKFRKVLNHPIVKNSTAWSTFARATIGDNVYHQLNMSYKK